MGITVACIAGGASLTADDVAYCKGRAKVLAINDAYRLAPWADWLYACDYRWWAYHAPEVRETFTGACWTRDADAAERFGLHWIKSVDRAGLSTCPTLIHEGGNSGFQAINLAYHFGADRIVLLGYDMHGAHWFGDHPDGLRVPSPYADFLRAFPALARDVAASGVAVVNCSPGSALQSFDTARLRDVL